MQISDRYQINFMHLQACLNLFWVFIIKLAPEDEKTFLSEISIIKTDFHLD